MSDPVGVSHAVYFYSSPLTRDRYLAQWLHHGLARQGHLMVIATSETHAQIRNSPEARASNPNLTPRYEACDADSLLSTCLTSGALDHPNVGAILERLLGDPTDPTTRYIYEEMSLALWSAGSRDRALELEDDWHRLAEQYPVSLVCGYPMPLFEDCESDLFLRLCTCHAQVVMDCQSDEVSPLCPI